MKPGFTETNIVANQSRTLPSCNSIRFASVTGGVTIQFDDGKAITVSTGDSFGSPWPLMFDRITIVAGGAGAATVVHGIGFLTGGSLSTGASGALQPTSGDPEGVLNAAEGQWAYDEATGALYLNLNTSGTTGWVNIIA